MQPKKGLANVRNRWRLSEAPRTPPGAANGAPPNSKRLLPMTLFYLHKCSDGADFEDFLGFFF
jgi:hypothetical protein